MQFKTKRQFFSLSLHQYAYEYRRAAAGFNFIGFAFLAENIGVVAGRRFYRMDYIFDYVDGVCRLGGQMRLGARFTEKK